MIGEAVALAGAIAFTQSPGIAVVTPGAAPNRIAEVGLAPAFSPDGRRLALVLRGDVWTLDADGGHAKRLTRTPDREGAPTWAPDGRALAFTRAGGIWTMRADGREERRLVVEGHAPAWGPRRKTLAPGPPRRLTDDGSARDPAFSPDGRRIAYASDLGGNVDLHVLTLATRTRSPASPTTPAPTDTPPGRRTGAGSPGSVTARYGRRAPAEPAPAASRPAQRRAGGRGRGGPCRSCPTSRSERPRSCGSAAAPAGGSSDSTPRSTTSTRGLR